MDQTGDDWRQDATAQLATARTYRGRIALYARAQQQNESRAARLTADFRVRERWIDSAKQALPPAESLPASVVTLMAEQDTAMVLCGEIIPHLHRAVLACNARATLAQARVDTLEALLARGVKETRCRVGGFLPCPGRGVAFLGGAILGAWLAR
jgi:hypothetical protein